MVVTFTHFLRSGVAFGAPAGPGSSGMSSPRSGTRVPFLVLLLVAAVALVSGCGGGDAEPEITDAVESHAPEDVPYSPSARFNQLIPDGAETDPRSDAVISRFVENANVHRVNIATTGEVPPIYRVSSDDPFLSVWVDGEKIRFRVPDQLRADLKASGLLK